MELVYDRIHEWISLGVRYFGGCCNVGAKELAKMNEIIMSV
jgi:S-methylmethionine-dependent homocysteine/selenocysteine methylase